MLSQEEVREKFIKRVEREKQTYIAKQIGVPKQVLSAFKLGKKNLNEKSLADFAAYLEKH